MSIEKIERPYEILVRFHPDGSAAVQFSTIHSIIESGQILAEQPGILVNLTLAQTIEMLSAATDYLPPTITEESE